MAGGLKPISVPCEDSAPLLVRRRLTELPGLGWQLGDAMLVASELVTNAVRHSGCQPEDQLVVSVRAGEEKLRLAVRDPGRSGDTAKVRKEPGWFGGLGLRIVDELADGWGSERDSDGYEVWAELPFPALAPEPERRLGQPASHGEADIATQA